MLHSACIAKPQNDTSPVSALRSEHPGYAFVSRLLYYAT